MEILHHGAVGGVTGSCHELRVGERDAVLIDCGLFQGAENSGDALGSCGDSSWPPKQPRDGAS